MIDLHKFCGKTREDWTATPVAVGRFVYATDGMIIVRIDRESFPEQIAEADAARPLFLWRSIDFEGHYVKPADTIKPVNGRVFVGRMVFDEDRWALVSSLPGFQYNDTMSKGPWTAYPLSFKFDGGCGAVMPRSPWYEKENVGHG